MSAYGDIHDRIMKSSPSLWSQSDATQVYYSGTSTGPLPVIQDDGKLQALRNEARAEDHTRRTGNLLLTETQGWNVFFAEIKDAKHQGWIDKQERLDLMDACCRKFAQEASGDVKAYTRDANPDRVFLRVELPELLMNDRVKTINGVGREDLLQIQVRAQQLGQSASESIRTVNDSFSNRPRYEKTMQALETTAEPVKQFQAERRTQEAETERAQTQEARAQPEAAHDIDQEAAHEIER